jgi:hypothetical protein
MNETDWVIPQSTKLPFVGIFWQSLLGYGMLMSREAELTKVPLPVINKMIVENSIAPNDSQVVPKRPVFYMQEVVL